MKIVMIGSFDVNHPRNRILIRGLRLAGAEVLPYSTTRGYLSRFLNAVRTVSRVDYDVLLLGHIGQYYVPLMKSISHGPIVLDLFAPLFETLVIDRKTFKQHDVGSLFCYLLDYFGMKLSNLSIIDTYVHRDYLCRLYGVPKANLAVIYPGSDDSVIYPLPPPNKARNKFTVSYHGAYIPFHGVETILHAAHLLKNQPDIAFTLLGDGQTYQQMKRFAARLNLTNVTFVPRTPYSKLRYYLAGVDLCLGVFGSSPKLDRVVPFKIFDAMAVRKPIVTAYSKACSEILTEQKHCLFCERSDPHDLAAKIMTLYQDRTLADELGTAGHRLYKQKFTPLHFGRALIASIENMQKQR